MTLEQRDIAYFVAVAEHRHVGRAADALGLGQPALSKSLRRLERAAGTPLFARTPKGMELTAGGAALLARASRLKLAFQDVMQELLDISQGLAGQVRIGALAGFLDYPVAEACRLMMREAPHVALSASIEPVDTLVPALGRGEIDIAIVSMPASPDSNLVLEHLFDDEFVVVASPRHRLAKRGRARLADVAKERWILSTPSTFASKNLFQAFEQAGLAPPRVGMRTPSLELRDVLVSTTDCLGYSSVRVTRSVQARTRLAEVTVKELAWTRRVGVAYRRHGYLSPAATRFIKLLRSTAAAVGQRA